MSGSLLSPEEFAQAWATDPCPRWQRLNVTGWCVDKWWAGGPFSSLVTVAGVFAGMTVLGVVLSHAMKFAPVKGLIQRAKKAHDEVNFLKNKSRGRARHNRRRRR